MFSYFLCWQKNHWQSKHESPNFANSEAKHINENLHIWFKVIMKHEKELQVAQINDRLKNN